MELTMNSESSETEELLGRARAGDDAALGRLFDGHRERLCRMVRLRLDRRLSGRVDPDDVVQEAYLDVHRRFGEYEVEYAGRMPVYLWFRLVVGQRLVDLHRHHLGAQKRDAGLEVSLHRGPMPSASSASLAAQLLGKLTSASRAAIRAEHRLIVQEALNAMDEVDREVLVLRHFEQMSNDEVAIALGLKRSTASRRYIQALIRLKQVLASIPGLEELR
jgi:RNA polymerase sigma-70 factor (ECF subfamily)